MEEVMLNEQSDDGVMNQLRLREANRSAGQPLEARAQGQVLPLQGLQQGLCLKPLPLVQAILVSPPAVSLPLLHLDACALEKGQQPAEARVGTRAKDKGHHLTAYRFLDPPEPAGAGFAADKAPHLIHLQGQRHLAVPESWVERLHQVAFF